MPKILGLDLGEKKVGVAISDVDQTIAFPRKIIRYKKVDDLFTELKKIIDEEGIDTLVIGLPISLRGEATEQTTKVKELADKIKISLKVNIEYVDERFTSTAAKDLLKDEKKKYRQQDIDDISAQKILQTYLDKL